MPQTPLSQDQIQALSAGAAFLAAYLLAAVAIWLAGRMLHARVSPFTMGIRHWPGWAPLSRTWGLVLAVGYPYAMVLTGAFSAGDIGLTPVDWSAALPWIVTLSLSGALWIGLLWGAHRRRVPSEGPHLSWLATLADLLTNEGTAAVARGALVPLAGTYWGIWLAPVAKMLVARLSPHLMVRLGEPGRRETMYLGWALDWFAAVVYAFGGGVWGALIARLLGRVAAGMAMRLAARRPPAPSTSAASTR